MSDIGFYKFLKGILSAVKETYICEVQIKSTTQAIGPIPKNYRGIYLQRESFNYN
jgi:hypothetical protein